MNQVVLEVGEIDWNSGRGMWIPAQWFHRPELQHESGKPNLNAMLILADIMYWYRPTYTEDPENGERIPKQKFAGDRYQKSRSAWAKQFGLTVQQVKDACAFLREQNLIITELKAVKMPNGKVQGNVAFHEPILENVKKITFESIAGDSVIKTIEDQKHPLVGTDTEGLVGTDPDPLVGTDTKGLVVVHPERTYSTCTYSICTESNVLKTSHSNNNASGFYSDNGNTVSSGGNVLPDSTRSTVLEDSSKPDLEPGQSNYREELQKAVLDVTGFTTKYQIGTFSPAWKHQFQKVLLMLEMQQSSVADVYAFGERFSQWVGSDRPTPPRPSQMLDFWDQVLSYDPATDKRRQAIRGDKQAMLERVRELKALRKQREAATHG